MLGSLCRTIYSRGYFYWVSQVWFLDSLARHLINAGLEVSNDYQQFILCGNYHEPVAMQIRDNMRFAAVSIVTIFQDAIVKRMGRVVSVFHVRHSWKGRPKTLIKKYEGSKPVPLQTSISVNEDHKAGPSSGEMGGDRTLQSSWFGLPFQLPRLHGSWWVPLYNKLRAINDYK